MRASHGAHAAILRDAAEWPLLRMRAVCGRVRIEGRVAEDQNQDVTNRAAALTAAGVYPR
jgi:hypothetical protein